MPVKRKRESVIVAREAHASPDQTISQSENHPNVEDIFRQYFEAEFEPLRETKISVAQRSVKPNEHGDDAESDESEWHGISEDETEGTVVQVVHYETVSNVYNDLDQPVSRSFMSARPPKSQDESRKVKGAGPPPRDDDPAESMNLKHDLDLQRLLNESHLLQKCKAASNPGSHRHQTLDMRLQSLGSKSSLFVQEKMPLSHRKGIVAKAADREQRRRQDAQENGVILERAAKVRKPTEFRKKDPGIGAPVVGKFRGGTLKLSRKDLYDIQGPTQRAGGKRRPRS